MPQSKHADMDMDMDMDMHGHSKARQRQEEGKGIHECPACRGALPTRLQYSTTYAYGTILYWRWDMLFAFCLLPFALAAGFIFLIVAP